MLALPLICSSLAALALAPGACRSLAAGPLARVNYRGARIASPLGLVIVGAALLALVPLVLVQLLAGTMILLPALGWIAFFVLGVALLGLADDALADESRGLRGHLAALRAGRPGTGTLKAAGTLGLALLAMLWQGAGTARFLLGAAVLVLATHAFNLIDLRPGRAIKALVLLGGALTVADGRLRPLWALGLFAGPVLGVGWFDLRERGMLGDTGAGIVGALAGAWLVLTLSASGLVVALAALVALALYGELRSISAFVERAPIVRHLDWIGRLHDAIDA